MRLLLVLLGLAFAGCTSNYVLIPKTLAWVAPADASPVSALQTKLTVELLLPNAAVYTSDSNYVRVNHDWLVGMIDWSTGAAKMLGFTYTTNSRNCTKFAMALYIAMTDAAARAGVELTPLIARLVVQQDHAFAAVEGAPGTRHEVLGLYTDRPPYYWVAEPQPSGQPRLIPLQDYPNTILSVVLGDFNP